MNRLLLLLSLAALITIAASCVVSRATEADRIRADAYAQATITLANAESRQATAAAITPVVAMAMVGFLTLVVLGLPATLFVLFFLYQHQSKHQSPSPARIIEQRTLVLMPPAGISRRQMYQHLGTYSHAFDRRLISPTHHQHHTQSEVIR